MTNIPDEEETCTCNEDLEYRCMYLERILENLLVGMEALEESRDLLRAENIRLKTMIDISSKRLN